MGTNLRSDCEHWPVQNVKKMVGPLLPDRSEFRKMPRFSQGGSGTRSGILNYLNLAFQFDIIVPNQQDRTMPHERPRHAEGPLKKALTYSPCTGLIGMRQVGKSTLLKKQAKTYHTFDDDRFRLLFEREGHGILESDSSPLALDEIQKYPPAFDMLKVSIDRLKKPGRFLVSGSVRFGSRRQIRESLTGRIVLIELFPFTSAECHGRPASRFLQLLERPARDLPSLLSKNAWASERQVRSYLEIGGLPGICFRRDPAVRSDLFAAHLETLLARDIQLVRKTNLPFQKLLQLLGEVAKNQGLPTNVSHLARLLGASPPTIRQVLDALHGLFLIRPYGNTWFVEDPGLSSHLSPVQGAPTRFDRIRLLHTELQVQLAYQLGHRAIRPYQTRGGIDIPFLVEFKNGKRVALCVDDGKVPSNKTLKSLSWAGKRMARLEKLILLDSDKAFMTSTGIPCFPWTWAF